jgi:protein-tyrosine phosphatase
MKILFVCTANICRSPTAEGVFRRLVEAAGLGDAITADSCGLIGFHVGPPPDLRAQAVARRRGFELADLRARRLTRRDFGIFDLVLAMDNEHHRALLRRCPRRHRDRIRHFLDFAPELGWRGVPDPFFGDEADFEHAFDLIEAGAQGLLAALRRADA